MKNKTVRLLFLISLPLFVSSGCSSDYIPKPKGYNHIEIPEHDYLTYTEQGIPYSFELSKQATIANDTFGIVGDGWKIISYPDLNASIYVTYEPIRSKRESYDLISDSYKIAYKHDVKAYAIERRLAHTKEGQPVIVFELEGEVPSPYQFFTHDSDTANYFRGAVYFPIATKNDSLRPVINYITEDMNHLISTFEWKK
ncbi:MAG: gliding motility lipoprotein GldD [Cyclobacteriaceae bacterium]